MLFVGESFLVLIRIFLLKYWPKQSARAEVRRRTETRIETPDSFNQEVEMKKLLKPAFCLILVAVFAMGSSLVFAPEVEAAYGGCPLCTVPPGGGGWSVYSTCDDFSDPHCPLLYRTYRNDYTGQICRGTTPIANI